MNSNVEGKPWTFWFSSVNPHRPYEVNSGYESGMDKSKVVVPSYLPDNDVTKGDILDYYLEIQKFDDEVGEILETLKGSGQWDNIRECMGVDCGWYDEKYYEYSPKDNPLGPETGERRVSRGGSWEYLAVYLRSASRRPAFNESRLSFIGC